MKCYLLEEQTDVEKREEPRRRCSVYVTFDNGYQVKTARIVDCSDSGLRLQTSGDARLGHFFEIIESESPKFRENCGRIMWQRTTENGAREFGVRLEKKEQIEPESRLDRMWQAIQEIEIAFEDVFA